MIKHSQSTQSNKFGISLQYLKEELSDGVHFLHADKHQNFYKVALLFFMKVIRHVQSTQNRKLGIFLQYLKKKILTKFVFLHSGKHESFLQDGTNILGVFGQI